MLAVGLDPGTVNTGIAVVRTPDELLYSGIIYPYEGLPWKRVRAITAKVVSVCAQYHVDIVGIERYIHYRDVDNTENMNWLIGALIAAAPPGAGVMLYTVSEWRARLIGQYAKRMNKEAARRVLEARLGQRFTTRGMHDMDAAGIALVALDEGKMLRRSK